MRNQKQSINLNTIEDTKEFFFGAEESSQLNGKTETRHFSNRVQKLKFLPRSASVNDVC